MSKNWNLLERETVKIHEVKECELFGTTEILKVGRNSRKESRGWKLIVLKLWKYMMSKSGNYL
jgi:hypothetical protein